MDTHEFLLYFNSALLTLLGVLLGIVGFFFRDLYRDFKKQSEKVSDLSRDLLLHQKDFSLFKRLFEKLLKRMGKLEKK